MSHDRLRPLQVSHDRFGTWPGRGFAELAQCISADVPERLSGALRRRGIRRAAARTRARPDFVWRSAFGCRIWEPIERAAKRLAFTVSIGVAECRPAPTSTISKCRERLLALRDVALYESTAAGLTPCAQSSIAIDSHLGFLVLEPGHVDIKNRPSLTSSDARVPPMSHHLTDGAGACSSPGRRAGRLAVPSGSFALGSTDPRFSAMLTKRWACLERRRARRLDGGLATLSVAGPVYPSRADAAVHRPEATLVSVAAHGRPESCALRSWPGARVRSMPVGRLLAAGKGSRLLQTAGLRARVT